MITLIEKLVQKRNPRFVFDKGMNGAFLLSLVIDKTIGLIRGLKTIFYGRLPKYLLLGANVRMVHYWNIRLGKYVKIDDYVTLNALGKGKLVIGDNCGIGSFSKLVISTSFSKLGSHIHIGNNVGIGEYAYLGGAGGLDIGDECIIGQYFSCHPENHLYENPNTPIRFQDTTRIGIKIGKNCWIGSKVTILDGVVIGDNCVVAAGAVVTKSMPSNSVIAGVPAKVVKSTTHLTFNPMAA